MTTTYALKAFTVSSTFPKYIDNIKTSKALASNLSVLTSLGYNDIDVIKHITTKQGTTTTIYTSYENS